PREVRKVKMYTCGPSIYRQPHIGNYRTFLFEDILQRYLEYLGYNVVRLLTFTDVEDKAIAEADKEKVSISELTQRNMDTFFADAKLLKIKSPTYNPRSSTTVNQAVKLIRILLEKGLAYWYKANVYFDPLKFKEFGKLSKLDMSRWPKKKRRFHKDTYPGMPWNRGDFILWHGYKKGDEVYWKTEIGKGRPAWNVQDGAMVSKHLGFVIDIACGGIDNLVRHHDYTIAVVEGVSSKEFAHYWFHGEHLFVDGKKMSKSRGNVYYPNDLLKMGHRREHIRFFLIYGHYRKRWNFTFKKLKKTSQKLDTFKNTVDNLQKNESAESSEKAKKLVGDIVTSFERNMNNDLNVKAAFDDLFKIVSGLNTLRSQSKLSSKDACIAVGNLQKIDRVLQIFSFCQ
ncbi:MAG: class I tRNA ligase family protein, partial [Candidatus Bathyarchaeia archaeon]